MPNHIDPWPETRKRYPSLVPTTAWGKKLLARAQVFYAQHSPPAPFSGRWEDLNPELADHLVRSVKLKELR